MPIKITIKYNRFLDPIFIAWIKSQDRFKDWKEPVHEDVLKCVKKYNVLWDKYGAKIIKGLEKSTGMSFQDEKINIYIVSGNPRPFNNPLIMKSSYAPRDFLLTLTHELIHCLFTQNNIPLELTHKLFVHEDKTTSAHIPVYAILKYIFKDTLKMHYSLSNHSKNIKKTSVNISYRLAMEEVEKLGYKNILKTIREKVVTK